MRITFARVSCLLAAALAGCATDPGVTPPDQNPSDPNAGLLRDFLDGKYDSAGHPLNAIVTEGEILCATAGTPHDATIRLDKACESTALSGVAQQGDLVANARLRVHAHAASGDIVKLEILGPDDKLLGTQTLTAARLRHASWIDWPVSWHSDGTAVKLRLTPATGAIIDLDYVEVFPEHFKLVLSPGSGVVADADHLVFELPRSHKVDKLEIDGADATAAYLKLLDDGVAKKTSTAFRTLVEVGVAELVPARGDVVEVKVHAGAETARMQLRRSAAPCAFEGSGAKRVLVTGFQPFPADGWHDNVSGVAVMSLDPSKLRGAQVMRLVLPVEYDRAAAEVTDAIARCKPDVVISFGQGGGEIALEEVAYNLQDTGEIAGGGVPDNRGIMRVATPIDAAAPATRDTLLPIDKIEAALVAAGEAPQHSRDPGRYICNNVMFADIGAMTGKRAGFIHLPYTTDFDDATRARFGKVVELAIQASVD